MHHLTRRGACLGAFWALGGCSALTALNDASEVLDTYDLAPMAGAAAGRRSARKLLVALPEAPAVLATDRITVKPDVVSITYLPDARWGEELPGVVQSLLIRSIAGTGRIGYVGASGTGPVPDKALLTRIDAFEVRAPAGVPPSVEVDLDLTLIDDGTQSLTASRRFRRSVALPDDSTGAIVNGFQNGLNALLPEIADWVLARVRCATQGTQRRRNRWPNEAH